MVMINGNWEQIKDLSDVLRIVSENIGDEFAQKVEEIFNEKEQKFTRDLQDIRSDLKEYKNLIGKMKKMIEIT